jgi:cell division septal protein FtsQ
VYRRGVRKQKIKLHKTAQGFGSVGVFLFVCVVLVGVLYLFSTNDIAIKGDEIYTIEQEIKVLVRENEQLVIQEAQLRSLENVENVIKDKGMKEVIDPVYIERELRVALD